MKVKKEGSSSADPLGRVISHSELRYAKLHSPKMKSVYWRHFGFPTNEDDRIITKQSVVCTLCFKVLTNHGNTTNLRAHLQHRHKDIFNKMVVENNIKVPPRKIQNTPKKNRDSTGSQRRIKIEYADESMQDNSIDAGISTEDQSMLYETMVPMTYEDDEIIDTDHFTKVEVAGGFVKSRRVNSGSNANSGSIVQIDTKEEYPISYRVDVIDEMGLQEALVNLIIMDVLNVDALYDPGMAQFVRMISGTIVLPTEKKVVALIKEMHSDKFTTMAHQIKLHSQHKPFSLGFEMWSNAEQRNFLTIYFNHTTDAPDYTLVNQLYCTIEYNKFISIDAVFEEFNMNNCTAAIVSYDCDDYLRHYLKEKRIPAVLSFDVVADKCLRSIFSLPDVSSIYDEVKDTLMRFASELSSRDFEIPLCNDDFPWTYYETLKFFSETVTWTDDLELLVKQSKIIVDAVNALVVTIDTLKGEEIPHSSILAPITSKILSKKLALLDGEEELVATIKTTIAAELQKHVIEEHHLTISALLDPRFHRLTNVDHYESCLEILKEKYNKLISNGNYCLSNNKSGINKAKSSTNTKRTNLELFFDLQETQLTDEGPENSDIEADLKRYRQEVRVNLDESPFSWWNKFGHVYPSLKQMAQLYQCLPCVTNMNFKKPIKQQISEFQKRYVLSGTLIDAILFLHHNGK